MKTLSSLLCVTHSNVPENVLCSGYKTRSEKGQAVILCKYYNACTY